MFDYDVRLQPEDLHGVHELVERQVRLTPDAIAVKYGEFEITYSELNARANQLARYLQRFPVGPATPVAVSLDRSPELVAAILAIAKTGAACVPIDAGYPDGRRQFMLEASGAGVLLTTNSLSRNFQTAQITKILIDVQWPQIDRESEDDPGTVSSASDPFYIIFTSGSTGNPKGVVMPHGPIANLISWHLLAPDAPGSVWDGRNLPARTLQFAPITFDVSFQEIFTTWANGGTLILVSEQLRLDPDSLLNYLIDEEVERLYLPVVMLQQIAEAVAAGAPMPHKLRDIITAGEALRISPEVAAFFEANPSCSLHNHYGPSETHVVTTYRLSGSPSSWAVFPPIGRPIWNTAAYVLDESAKPVSPGSEGELFVGGACLSTGYAGRPDLTAERFVDIVDPAEPARTVKTYKTGDRVRLNAKGELEYIGRIDQQIKIRGYRVEPGEVEEALIKHPDVAQAVVVAMAHSGGDKTLAAYIVPTSETMPNSSALRRLLRSTLPDYMIPAKFVVISSIPLTSSGKIDRKSLAERQLDPIETELTPEYGSLYFGMEEFISAQWRRLLHTDQVGYDDNFFEIGGTSIQAVRLHRHLKEQLHHDFPITILFDYPTITLLSNYFREHGGVLADVSGNRSTATLVDPMEQINRLREFRNSLSRR